MNAATHRHYRPSAPSWFSFRRALCSEAGSLSPTPINDLGPLAGPPYSTAIQLASSRSLLFGLDAAGPFLSYTDHIVPLENIEFIQLAGTTSRELLTMVRTVLRNASFDFQERNRSPLFFPDVVPTDNCTFAGSFAKNQNPAASTTVGLGTHTVSVTAEDAADNVGTFSTFAVIDITSPSMTSPCQWKGPTLLLNEALLI
jgi:hypothetical protein